jgi:phosphate transport system permease protein
MTDAPGDTLKVLDSPAWQGRLRRRLRAEALFRAAGIAGIGVGLAVLAVMLASIVGNAAGAFRQTEIRLEIVFDATAIDPQGERDSEALAAADYAPLIRAALYAQFPDVQSRTDRRDLYGLISHGAEYALRDRVVADPALIGRTETIWLLASSDIDRWHKGGGAAGGDAAGQRLKANQVAWYESLRQQGAVAQHFNVGLFSKGDSRTPETAGIAAAVVGSAYALLICLLTTLPLGVGAAVYLEEFAPRNRLTDLIEVTVNNLAAVPSIVFGLLGLMVFQGLFGMPRSAALVGGLVLALMTLPVITIAGRAALTAVPPSIREAALAIGASRQQVVWHHVLPLALPGILTGAIIGLARALGETAPLLLIGMVAFVVDVPAGPTSPATALPVQIFMWSDRPDAGFAEKAAAAILILLVFLAVMNALAIWLRKRYEVRW